MDKHQNLYYLFAADKAKNPMPEQKKEEIRKNLENFYKKIKPP